MSKRLVSIAAFLPFLAAAQSNPCGTQPQIAIWTAVDFKPYVCAPALTGPTSQVRVSPGKGYVGWFSCVGPDGKLTKNVAAVTNDRLLASGIPAQLADAFASADSTTLLTKLNAVLTSNIDTNWSDPKLAAVWCPFERELVAFLQPPVPVPPAPVVTFIVSKYSTQLTRPAYPVVAGKRSTTAATQRATVGVACDCTTPIVEGPSPWSAALTYCPAAGLAAGLVTQCEKKP